MGYLLGWVSLKKDLSAPNHHLFLLAHKYHRQGIFKKFPSILKTRDPDDSSNTEDLHLIRVSAYLWQVTSHLLPLILINFEF